MSDELTPERLEEIRERTNAATEGPWFATRYYVGAGEDHADPDAEIATTGYKADAAFIAAAREDVPALLAEVDRLRAIVGPLEAHINARTEYVQVCRQTVEVGADYWRWQGHMEARRQLAQSLGWTVPYEPGDKTAPEEAQGCPTCTPPHRETVGLVCQTCGTDYGQEVDRG